MELAVVWKGCYRSILSTCVAPVRLREIFPAGTSAARHEPRMIQNLCRPVKHSQGSDESLADLRAGPIRRHDESDQGQEDTGGAAMHHAQVGLNIKSDEDDDTERNA